jgi:hypothetical protein
MQVLDVPARGTAEGCAMPSPRSRLATSVFLAVWIATPAPSAAAFGTIDSGGQHREHERITRAALSCASETSSHDDCFEPVSIDLLAGHDREFGAVGAPDSDEIFDPAAHCDNADFLGTDYPRTREQATAGLLNCVDHVRMRFREGVEGAGGLLDDDGQVIEDDVDLASECRVFEATERRAKCAALEAFGRVLHGVQDFYSHSNWADTADPARPIAEDNPPGLNLPAPSSIFDLGDETPDVPPDVATGCFVVQDEVPGAGDCAGRVTHAALNKDTGRIDPATGETTDPTTARGMVGDNFAKAVAGAIEETRRQWRDLQAALSSRYGAEEAALMTCALTHDDPVDDCRGRDGVPILVGVLAGVVVLGVVAGTLIRARRRPRD